MMRIRIIKEGNRPIQIEQEWFDSLMEDVAKRLDEYIAAAKKAIRTDLIAMGESSFYLNKFDPNLRKNILEAPFPFRTVDGEIPYLHVVNMMILKNVEETTGELTKATEKIPYNVISLYLPDIDLVDYADDDLQLRDVLLDELEAVLRHEIRHLKDIYTTKNYIEAEDDYEGYLTQADEVRAFLGDFYDQLGDYLDTLSREEILEVRKVGLINHLRNIEFSLRDIGLEFGDYLDTLKHRNLGQLRKFLKPLAAIFHQKIKEKTE